MRISSFAGSIFVSVLLASAEACVTSTEPEPSPPIPTVTNYEFSTVIGDMVFPRGILKISKDSVTNVRSDTTVTAIVRIGPDSTISFVLDIGTFDGRGDSTDYIFGTYSSGNVTGRWLAHRIY